MMFQGVASIACHFMVALLVLAAVPAHADDVVQTQGATLRLINGAMRDGVVRLGLEIAMKPGWHTYWRYPGDSGVPPEITLADPTIATRLAVHYPAPRRFGTAGDETIGYEGDVVLPIDVAPTQPGRQVDIGLNVRLGICHDICLPVDETLSVTVDPTATPDAIATMRLSNATTAVPQPVASGADLSVFDVRRNPSAKPEIVTFAVRGSSQDLVDVFVEGPEGWALPLPTRISGDAGASRWQIALDGAPSGAATKGVPLKFTLVGKTRAAEQTLSLD
jgi:DsbC/DsbD-like thiol-disulfide interchange protein